MNAHQQIMSYGANAVPQGYPPPAGPGYPTAAFGDQREDAQGFDILGIFVYVMRHRWLLAAFLLVGIVAGVALTWMQVPMYRASAELEISVQNDSPLQDLELVTQRQDLRTLSTARRKIESRDLIRRVVIDLDLANRPDFIAVVPSFSPTNLLRRIMPLGDGAAEQKMSAEMRENRAIAIVARGLDVSMVRNTFLVQITYQHSRPKYASMVANQVAKSFIDQSVQNKFEVANNARDFVGEQVVNMKAQLERAEKALVEYAEREGLTLNQDDDSSQVSVAVSDVNKQLAEVDKDLLQFERYAEQIARFGAKSLPQFNDNPSVQTQLQKIADLEAEYRQNLATLKPGFPSMRKLSAQIGSLKANVDRRAKAIGGGVRLQLDQLRTKAATLRARLGELETEQADLRRKNIRYTILKRDADSSREQYQSLVKKLNEIGVGAELKTASAALVEAAQTPGRPYAPVLAFNLAGTLAFFMLLGGGMVYVLELLNNTFAVPEQLEEELKAPVLGLLPKVEPAELQENLADPSSGLSEAFRTLRTSLQFASADGLPKILLVTSSGPSEGKTTVGTRLAGDLAALGNRVVIIDADMRRPRLHRELNLDNTMGLSNMLTNTLSRDDLGMLFKQTKYPNLSCVTAGPIPPNAADLLAQPRTSMVLNLLARKFDMVVVDAPPVIGLADAPLLSSIADATLFVVSCKQISRKAAKAAITRLRRIGGNVVGTVFNKFAVEAYDYQYSYRYMSDSYYAYGSTPQVTADKDGGAAHGEPKRNILAFMRPGGGDRG